MNPEDIFDSAVRTNGEFKSRLDLTAVEDPSLCLLLTGLKDAMNSVHRRDSMRVRLPDGNIPSIHFDFMASRIPNAIAFEAKESRAGFFIGVSLGMVERCIELSTKLGCSPRVHAKLGLDHSAISCRQLTTGLLTTTLQFIYCHELGHHFLGHTKKAPRVEHPAETGAIYRQAEELMADKIAVGMVLENLVFGQAGKNLCGMLAWPAKSGFIQKMIDLFVFAIGGFFWSERHFTDFEELALDTHPLPSLRLESAMSATEEFLSSKKMEHYGILKPTVFKHCMDSIVEALGGGAAWIESVTFLESPAGVDFSDKLTSAYRIRSECREDWWTLLAMKQQE